MFMHASPHLAVMETLADRAALESCDRNQALGKIKCIVDITDGTLNDTTVIPNVALILPMIFINVMFLFNEAWAAYDLTKGTGVIGDGAVPESFNQ